MSARALHLVIDARPRGVRGPLAAEIVLGKSMLDHLLELADELVPATEPMVVHSREDERSRLSEMAARFHRRRVEIVYGPPRADAVVLRTDRYYDFGRLKRGLRRGQSPESAVLWRLDRAETLAKADEELIRRRSYQPLGKYWAFPLAQRLAEWLTPTVIRPNALTIASSALMLCAATMTAAGFSSWGSGVLVAISLATALVLDTADGRLARLQGTSSAFGRWLDQVLDELADVALHAAIAWAAYCRTGGPGWLLLGIAYASSKYLFQVQSLLGEELEGEMKREGASGRLEGSGGDVGHAKSYKERFTSLVRLIGHADLRWHLWIGLALFGRLDVALVAYALYFALRAIGGGVRKAVRYA
jgi:phosphatidylglycerophosphate synthase